MHIILYILHSVAGPKTCHVLDVLSPPPRISYRMPTNFHKIRLYLFPHVYLLHGFRFQMVQTSYFETHKTYTCVYFFQSNEQ